MAKSELGTKRVCAECGAKFYDLNKDPITCPKCGAVFQPAAVAVPRGRAAPAAAARAPVEEAEPETSGAEIVSLDDVAAEEEKAAATDDDAEEETAAEDDAFLEPEEEGDDVAGLIDGDIENDEEA